MIVSRRCLKCERVAEVEDSPTAACPSCGAIYAKAMARPSTMEGVPPTRTPITAPTGAKDLRAFVDRMRADSIYPTFRSVVHFFYIFGLVLAAVSFVGGSVLAFTTKNMALAIGSLLGGIFWLVASKFFREATIMVADMGDALARIAHRS